MKLLQQTVTRALLHVWQVALLQCIGHPEQALRRTVGSSVAAVVAAAGLAAWPELVPALAAGLGAGDVATLEGSLDCLHKVSAGRQGLISSEGRRTLTHSHSVTLTLMLACGAVATGAPWQACSELVTHPEPLIAGTAAVAHP